MCFYNPFVNAKLRGYGKAINSTLYKSFLLGNIWSEEMSNIDYENVTININDYFLGYEIVYGNSTTITYDKFGENETINGWKLPHVELLAPYVKCFTVDTPFEHKAVVRKLRIKIETEIFPLGIRPHRTTVWNTHNHNGFTILFYYPKQVIRSKFS